MPRLSQRLIQYSNLATLTPEDLTAKTVTELRKLAPSLGIDGYSKMKKADLVSAIGTELDTLATIAEKETEKKDTAKQSLRRALVESSKTSVLTVTPLDIAKTVYKRLSDILSDSSKLDDKKLTINGVAATIASQEKSRGHTFSYIKSRRTDIFKMLHNMALQDTPLRSEDMVLLVECFKKSLLAYQRDESMNLNYEGKKQVAVKNNAKTPIAISQIVDDAKATLQALEAGLNPHWCDVSIAMILGSGRRMVEIHCLGNFEVIGDYEIAFSGQAKTRNCKGARTAFNIPTLFPAKLIKMGIDYLSDVGRRLPKEVQKEDTKAVNKKYNTALSRAMAKYPDTNYKGLRAIYAECAWFKYANQDTMEKHSFYSDILGHKNLDGLGDDTFKSYMTFDVTDVAESVTDRYMSMYDVTDLDTAF